MANDFHKKYNEKVNAELEKEVNSRFGQMLDRKLSEEKRRVTELLVKEQARKLHEERKKMVEKLESNYKKKQKEQHFGAQKKFLCFKED